MLQVTGHAGGVPKATRERGRSVEFPSEGNYPLGEKQEQGKGLASQGWRGQDRARYIQGEMMTNWHRTANTRIKGANEEGNKERQVGQINQ